MENVNKIWIKDSILSMLKKVENIKKSKFSNRKTKDQYLKVIGSNNELGLLIVSDATHTISLFLEEKWKVNYVSPKLMQKEKKKNYYNPSDIETKIVKLPQDSFNISTLFEACDDRNVQYFQFYGITIPFSIKASKINLMDDFEINANYNVNGKVRENDINRDPEILELLSQYTYKELKNTIILKMFPISTRKLRSFKDRNYDEDEIQIENDHESRFIPEEYEGNISVDDEIVLDSIDAFDNREINNKEYENQHYVYDNMKLTLDCILKMEKEMSNQPYFSVSSIGPVPFSYTLIGKKIKRPFNDGKIYIGEIIYYKNPFFGVFYEIDGDSEEFFLSELELFLESDNIEKDLIVPNLDNSEIYTDDDDFIPREDFMLDTSNEETSKDLEKNLIIMQDEELSYIERNSPSINENVEKEDREEEEIYLRNVEIMNNSLEIQRLLSTSIISSINTSSENSSNTSNNNIFKNSKLFQLITNTEGEFFFLERNKINNNVTQTLNELFKSNELISGYDEYGNIYKSKRKKKSLI